MHYLLSAFPVPCRESQLYPKDIFFCRDEYKWRFFQVGLTKKIHRKDRRESNGPHKDISNRRVGKALSGFIVPTAVRESEQTGAQRFSFAPDP